MGVILCTRTVLFAAGCLLQVIDNDVAELFVWSTTENYLDEPPTFMCEVDVRGARPCGLNYDRNGQYNFTATGLTHVWEML